MMSQTETISLKRFRKLKKNVNDARLNEFNNNTFIIIQIIVHIITMEVDYVAAFSLFMICIIIRTDNKVIRIFIVQFLAVY